MSKLQDLIQEQMRASGLTARAVADRTGISYPTVLAIAKEGRVPRKPEHREALRDLFGITQAVWAGVIASSQKHGVDLPDDGGPIDLQQLLTKLLLEQGWTEQRFSKHTGIAYPTLMGITRKGAIPRGDTLPRLAKALNITLAELEVAADRSRSVRRGEEDDEADDADQDAGSDAPTKQSPAVEESSPRLPTLVNAAVERSGLSTAGFARERGVPYLVLSRLINQGDLPKDPEILNAIAAAAGLDRDDLATATAPLAQAPVATRASVPAAPSAAPSAPMAALAPKQASANDELAELTALFTRLPADSRTQLVALLRTLAR